MSEAHGSSQQQDHQEDAIVQIATDIRNSYTAIDITIKPTQIALTMLLKYAAAAHRHLTDTHDSNSRNQHTDKREERRIKRRARKAKYRMMASHSNKLVQVASEYSHCSRVANVRPANDCISQYKVIKEPTLQYTSMTSISPELRPDSPTCDSEILRITSQIVQDDSQSHWPQDDDGRLSQQSRVSTSSSSCQCFVPRDNKSMSKRPQSWHSASSNQTNGREDNFLRLYSRQISDSDAKIISEPYRLMTATHNRLTSVSPPVNRYNHACPEAANSNSQGKKIQPVLGLRQRRRKHDLLRRRTVHGIVYHEPSDAHGHRRFHSDTALHDVVYQKPLKHKLHMSSYHQLVDSQLLQEVDSSSPTNQKEELDASPFDYVECDVSNYSLPQCSYKSTDIRGSISSTQPDAAYTPGELSYEYNETHSVREGSQYYYGHRHRSEVYTDDSMHSSEVYGRYGRRSGYLVALNPAELAIEEIWRHERELLGDIKLADSNNNSPTITSSTVIRPEKQLADRLAGARSYTARSPKSGSHVQSHHSPAHKDSRLDGESLVSVKAVPIQTTNVSPGGRYRLTRPVKRTASMPSQTQQPIYTADPNTGRLGRATDSIPNGPSQRPGRGVFTNSGRRVHEGQRHGENRPPRLPPRNSSPIENGGRSMSTDRANMEPTRNQWSSNNNKPSIPWAKRHTGNPDWSYSSSETSQKPIDQLRNRVRQQQERENQLKQAKEIPQQSNQMSHVTKDNSFHSNSVRHQDEGKHQYGSSVPQSSQAMESSRRSRNTSRRDQIQGVVTSQVSRSPSEYNSRSAPQQHETVPFKARILSPQRAKTTSETHQVGSTHHRSPSREEFSTRAHSPQRSKTFIGASQRHYAHNEPINLMPYITRTRSPERSKVFQNLLQNREEWSIPTRSKTEKTSNRPSTEPPRNTSQQTQSENAAALSQQRKAMAAKEYSDHPIASASNKYKMIVCPDFFPVAKLNGIANRKSRAKHKARAEDALVDEVFVDPSHEYSVNQEIGNFYTQRTSGMKPSQPIVQMDDSFVEDPKEQLLYPSNKVLKRSRSQNKDSADFYFEVSPSGKTTFDQETHSARDRGIFTTIQSSSPQVATEGDSLYSIHSSQQVPESGASLVSSRTSEGSQCSTSVEPNKRFSSPPAYQQALKRSQISSHFRRYTASSSQEPVKNLHQGEMETAQSDEYLEYCATEVAGQTGETARVVAHIEPAVVKEGSHYSTVSVYRKEERKHVEPKAAPFKPAWQQKSSPQERPTRDPARNIHSDLESNVRSQSQERGGSDPIRFTKTTNQRTKPVFVEPPRLPTTRTSLDIQRGHAEPEKRSAVAQLARTSLPTHPNQIQKVPETLANHDDKLLERIKAQNSSSLLQPGHRDSVYERIPVTENVYENLPHFEPIRVAKVKRRDLPQEITAVTNPDYIYPPTILSQSEPVRPSRSHLPNPSSSRSKADGNYMTETSGFSTGLKQSTTGGKQQIDPSTASKVKLPTAHPSHSSRDNKGQSDLLSSNRGTPDSSIKDHSSTTGSVTDDSLRRQKSVNFVEPPIQYVQSQESFHHTEDFTYSEASTNLSQKRESSGFQIEQSETYQGQLLSSPHQQISSPSSEAQSPTREGEDINSLMDNLATDNHHKGRASKGLGDDILSITKMWKNLPTNDSWDDKRRALLGDPIMSAITEKMEAILHPSAEEEEIREDEKTTLSVRSEALISEHRNLELTSPQSPSDVGLVTREPGEGSSDDLDESMDLTLKKLRHRQITESHLSVPTPKHYGNQSRTTAKPGDQSRSAKSSSVPRSGIPIRNKNQLMAMPQRKPKTVQSESTILPNSPISCEMNAEINGVFEVKQVAIIQEDDDDLSEDLFKIKRVPFSERRNSNKPLSSTQDSSDSDDSMGDEGEEVLAAPFKQDESDESDDLETEETGIKYLSDYHRVKAKSRQRSPPKKKISFSSDARKSRPGDLMTSNQSETLLSVNPFMTPSPTSETSNNLLSLNPFMSERGSSVGASPDSEADHSLGKKPRQGILKRSEDGTGSQLSLGTCSEFGSHISLASGDSGMSRAGSFPLLTMSDGSKKDFQITFNDTDTSDMGNLFKVVRKARSEGAASEPESTDSDSDDDATPIVCKNCHSKQPLFKARLLYKMCHGCYTYYCSSDCRRQDWGAHKPLCIVSRLSSLARKIFKCVMTDGELLHHCSRFARTGYLCEGRGAVVLSFSSPRKAQLFLSNAKQAKESALYLCVKDLQKFNFDDKRDKNQLISNCKHYNPDEKFVLHLAIKMTRSMSGQTMELRIKGREFHKWARIRLSERHNVPKGDRRQEDTLILTALSNAPEGNQDHSNVKAREVFFATVVTKLRKRGISLRHQYPDVYTALCQYVTSGRVFAPISLFAFNLHTQKRFMCCIMPYSDPDVTWGNNPHLMEDLDLVVTV